MIRIIPKAVLLAGMLLPAALSAFGQDSAAAPEFDVASIKPAVLQAGQAFGVGCVSRNPILFICTNAPLRMLVVLAYGIDHNLVSGPAWIDSQRFHVNAKVPPGSSDEQIHLMLRQLLADQLGLAVHRETREMQVYALVVGKGGSKLKDSQQSAPLQLAQHNHVTELAARGCAISGLVSVLQSHLDRHVMDETGLTGSYDFTLSFGDDSGAAMAPSVFSAVQNQLGLKLEAKKAPTEVLVVDKAGKAPSAN